ncbi:loricrin-like, partial [Stylophora pistillata]|uniref:loricrin-like n=1 Tax=Stylophora pistillata TaxID=50429 RepID=UPI000C04A9EE
GGGGGFYSSGRSSKQFGGTMGTGGEGGKGFLQGGVGGRANVNNVVGGFGGGAGAYGNGGGGGGGGGYSGGSSGDNVRDSCGGGGGSYNAGKNQQNECCYRSSGHGQLAADTYNAFLTNLNASGRFGPTTLGSHYTGQDHDGQVTMSSGIQQWTVPYTGNYRIEAIGAVGGYDVHTNSALGRGRGARMIGTFSLNKSEVIQILIGQEEGINKESYSSGGGGGTFVVIGANKYLIIAGGRGGINYLGSRHSVCDAGNGSSGNRGYKSWTGGSNGHCAQEADTGRSAKWFISICH